MARLIEFKNKEDELLRGIIDDAESDRAVVFVHGFEGTTIATRFKNFVDRLKGKVVLFRFDFAGVGLSDGDFSDMTIEKSVNDLNIAIETLKKETGVKNIELVAHSLGGVISAVYAKSHSSSIHKMVLLAPALNQKELNRFWYAQSSNKESAVTWQNYQDYLNEDAFQEFCNENRMAKEHYLKNDYIREVEGVDYQIQLSEELAHKIMIIHGSNDGRVPLESNNQLPSDILILKVENGDHKLARPDMVEKYLNQSIEFLER